MHTIESLALGIGAKIGRPFIFKQFFPVPFEKYLVFCPGGKTPGKEYSYYQDVIDLVFPYLENFGIKIVQIGPKDSFIYNGVVNFCGQLSISQAAYLISKAQAFLGVDGFECQVAGESDIPIIAIASLNYARNSGPFFGSNGKRVIYEGFRLTGNKKASFNINESPKTVNLIKPEMLAESILEKLNVGSEIKMETVFTGEKYSHLRIEESLLNMKDFPQKSGGLLEIRADLGYHEGNLVSQIEQSHKVVIVADSEINLDILRRFKEKIAAFVFKITEENKYPFLLKTKETGVNLIMISELPQEKIDEKKSIYYTLGNIGKIIEPKQEMVDKLRSDPGFGKMFYRSCKITISNNKYYYSLAAARADHPIRNVFEYQRVIDTPEFWKNMDFFTIIKLK